jgi:hypothetical protein
MFVGTHLFKRSLNLGCVILIVASAPAGARSEGLSGLGSAVGNAVGSAAKGIGGALGSVGGGAVGNTVGGTAKGIGGALGSKGGLAGAVDGHSAGNSPGNGSEIGNTGAIQEAARSGNWVGAPLILKRSVRVEGQDSCDGTFLDFLRSRACKDISLEAEQENPDQVFTSDDGETAVPDTNARAQAPIKKKAASPKSLARLDAGNSTGGKLEVVPQSAQPKTNDKDQPKSPLFSCTKAGNLVGTYGFSDIKPSDCEGDVLSFNARRDGKPFLITLNAVSGELIRVRREPPQDAH